MEWHGSHSTVGGAVALLIDSVLGMCHKKQTCCQVLSCIGCVYVAKANNCQVCELNTLCLSLKNGELRLTKLSS